MIGRINFWILVSVICISCSTRNNSTESDSIPLVSIDTIQDSKPEDSVTLIENADFDYEKASKIESYLVISSAQDSTTVIKSKCAVYVFPDGKILESMQKKYGDDYYTIADDANWYFSESSTLLDSLGVKQENIKTRYVSCNVNGVAKTIDLRAPTGLYWNLFFFHPTKEPKLVEMAGLSPDSVREYFDLPPKP